MVFGGNFLHSLSIKLQTEVFEIEQRVNVPFKFRFPFYGTSYWYLVENYVQTILKSHSLGAVAPISDWEQEGLVALVDWLPQWKFLAPEHMKTRDNLWMPQYLLDVIDWWLRKGSRQEYALPEPTTYQHAHFETVMSESPIRKPICVCRIVTEDPEITVVGCDFCGSWFHPECLSMTREEAHSAKMFYCYECIARNFSAGSADAAARYFASLVAPKAAPPKVIKSSSAPRVHTFAEQQSMSTQIKVPVASVQPQKVPTTTTMKTVSSSSSPASNRLPSPSAVPKASAAGVNTVSAAPAGLSTLQGPQPRPPVAAAPAPAPPRNSLPPIGVGRPLVLAIAETMNGEGHKAAVKPASNGPSSPVALPPISLGTSIVPDSQSKKMNGFSKAPGTPVYPPSVEEIPPRMHAVKRQEPPTSAEYLQNGIYGDPKRLKAGAGALHPEKGYGVAHPVQQQALAWQFVNGYHAVSATPTAPPSHSYYLPNGPPPYDPTGRLTQQQQRLVEAAPVSHQYHSSSFYAQYQQELQKQQAQYAAQQHQQQLHQQAHYPQAHPHYSQQAHPHYPSNYEQYQPQSYAAYQQQQLPTMHRNVGLPQHTQAAALPATVSGYFRPS